MNVFIWNNKPARIRRSVLQLPRSEGGQALPNFQGYYWASNINKILRWTSPKCFASNPPWLHIERSSSCSLHSHIYSQLPIDVHTILNNPVVSNTVKIWVPFRNQLGLHRASIYMPIFINHLFLPSLSDLPFDIWASKTLSTLNDLYENNFSDKYDLPNSRFFQVRHFTQKLFPHFPNRPPESELDCILTLNPGQRHLIAIIYEKIISLTPSPIDYYKIEYSYSNSFFVCLC